MSGFYVSNRLQAYFDFSDQQMAKGSEKAVSRIQGGVQSLENREIKVVASSGFGCEFVGNAFRSDETKAINTSIRDDFLAAVRNACGVATNEQLPEAVLNALKLEDYGKGLPLTARRIADVKAALYGAADKNADSWAGVAKEFVELSRMAVRGEIELMTENGFADQVTKKVKDILDRLHRQFHGQQSLDTTSALTQLEDFVQNDFLTALRSPSAFMISADDIRNQNNSKPLIGLFGRFADFLNSASGSNLLSHEGGNPSMMAGGRKLLSELARTICNDDLALLKQFLPESAQGVVPGFGDVELDVLGSADLVCGGLGTPIIPKGELEALKKELDDARTQFGFAGGETGEFEVKDLMVGGDNGWGIGFSDVTRKSGVPSQEKCDGLKAKFAGLCNQVAERTVDARISGQGIGKETEKFGLIKNLVYQRALVGGLGLKDRPMADIEDSWAGSVIKGWLSNADVGTLKRFDACGLDLFRFQNACFDRPEVKPRSFKPAFTALTCIVDDLGVDADKLKTAEGKKALLDELCKRSGQAEVANAGAMSDKAFGDTVTDLLAKIVRTNNDLQYQEIRQLGETEKLVETLSSHEDKTMLDNVRTALNRVFRTLKQGLTTAVDSKQTLAVLMDKAAAALVDIARQPGVTPDVLSTFADGMFRPNDRTADPRDTIAWLGERGKDGLVGEFNKVKWQITNGKPKIDKAFADLEATLAKWDGEGAKVFIASMQTAYAAELKQQFSFDWKLEAPDARWQGKELPKPAQRANELIAKLQGLETTLVKSLGEGNRPVVNVVMGELAKDYGLAKLMLKNQEKLLNLMKDLTGDDRRNRLDEIANVLRDGNLRTGGLFADGKAELRKKLVPALVDLFRPHVNSIELLRPDKAMRDRDELGADEIFAVSFLVGQVTKMVNPDAFAEIANGYMAVCKEVEKVHVGGDDQQRQNLKQFVAGMIGSENLEVSELFPMHLAKHMPIALYEATDWPEGSVNSDRLQAAFGA